MSVKFEKDGIVVELVLKSINTLNGARMMTLRCHYPRIIHAEVKTHSALKTNSASSRAVPVKAMNESILNDVAMPVRFGANQAGMQDRGSEHNGRVYHPEHMINFNGRDAWQAAAADAVLWADVLSEAGYHKQICNRVTEPYQWMDVIMSGSEWANLFWLRCDEDADPTFQLLADLCLQAYLHDSWDELGEGDYHLPFVHYQRDECGKQQFYTCEIDCSDSYTNGFQYEKPLTLEEAQLVSMSVSAQASFRKADATLEKALVIEQKLFSGKKVHASPSEHQAKVVGIPDAIRPFHHVPEGVTHITVEGQYGSGNLIGWVQLRQLIPNNHQSNMEAVLNNG
jgi:hypothetical protein